MTVAFLPVRVAAQPRRSMAGAKVSARNMVVQAGPFKDQPSTEELAAMKKQVSVF